MLEALLKLVEQNAEIAFIIVFLVAFAESLAVIGLFIPGWLLLVGIGGLIGQEVVNFYVISFAAFLGAVIGEYLSFYLGYHYHQAILNMPLVAKRKTITDYAREFFTKHGVVGVFIGRFLGPTRAFVPFIAGISQMNKKTFIWVNISSAMIWAPINLIPGILVGAAYQLESEQANQILMFLVFIAIAVVLVGHYVKKILRDNLSTDHWLKLKLVLSAAVLFVSVAIFVQHPIWQDFVGIIKTILTKL
jgi:membrane protein DedA with SNARE-associated domain